MRRQRVNTVFLWVAATAITLTSVVFQRLTGPTYPVLVDHGDGTHESVSGKLLTSHTTDSDASVVLIVSNAIVSGSIKWRRVNSDDPWQNLPMVKSGDSLAVSLPHQPMAGKIAYTITVATSSGRIIPLTPAPVVVRFKGSVPPVVLIPHIVFMFISMLLASRVGLEAVAKRDRCRIMSIQTAVLLLIGGLILGPIVQNYAFGAYWTGWPIGHDLTDNKTALAMVMWMVAVWRGFKAPSGRFWYVAAAMVHLLIYLIPHSMFGSELDYGGDAVVP